MMVWVSLVQTAVVVDMVVVDSEVVEHRGGAFVVRVHVVVDESCCCCRC